MGKPLDPNDPQVQLLHRYGPYGYVPDLVPATIFTAAFAALTVWHLVLVVRHELHRRRLRRQRAEAQRQRERERQRRQEEKEKDHQQRQLQSQPPLQANGGGDPLGPPTQKPAWPEFPGGDGVARPPPSWQTWQPRPSPHEQGQPTAAVDAWHGALLSSHGLGARTVTRRDASAQRRPATSDGAARSVAFASAQPPSLPPSESWPPHASGRARAATDARGGWGTSPEVAAPASWEAAGRSTLTPPRTPGAAVRGPTPREGHAPSSSPTSPSSRAPCAYTADLPVRRPRTAQPALGHEPGRLAPPTSHDTLVVRGGGPAPRRPGTAQASLGAEPRRPVRPPAVGLGAMRRPGTAPGRTQPPSSSLGPAAGRATGAYGHHPDPTSPGAALMPHGTPDEMGGYVRGGGPHVVDLSASSAAASTPDLASLSELSEASDDISEAATPEAKAASFAASGVGPASALPPMAGIASSSLWYLILPVGCALECGGHALRIYGHWDSLPVDPYIAQQCLLVITPVFFAAAHFTILGRYLTMFPRSAVVSPRLVIAGFVTVDFVSLCVQGLGSGVAAVAETKGESVDLGSQIVLGGLVMQLLAYLAFDALFLLFVRAEWRRAKEARISSPTPPGQALGLSGVGAGHADADADDDDDDDDNDDGVSIGQAGARWMHRPRDADDVGSVLADFLDDYGGGARDRGSSVPAPTTAAAGGAPTDAAAATCAVEVSPAWKLERQQRLAHSVLLDRRHRAVLVCTFASAMLVLTRTSFRTAEMAAGWISDVATTQWLFYAWDAAPISLAVALLAAGWAPGLMTSSPT